MTTQSELDKQLAKIATDYRKLNAKQQEFAIKEIGRVRLEIVDLLAEYSGDDGIIAKRRLNSLLRDLEAIENSVRQAGMVTLEAIIAETATVATTSISGALTNVAGTSALSGVAFDRINKQTLQYVVNRFGEEDGLVLSDRVWKLAGDQRDALSKVLRSGIIRGESVNKMIANVRKVQDNETWKIRRLVVTEGNIANRAATAYNAQASDIVQGLKIHRGRANKPEHRCTALSKADDYGLGIGVYPKDNTEIWSPHVSCTSFITYVLDEEVR